LQLGEEPGQVAGGGLVEHLDGPVEVALGPPQAGHHGVPAEAVLRQGGRVAELARGREVNARRVELVLLDQRARQPDVQVAGDRQRDAGTGLGVGQRPLVKPARVGRFAPGQPHLGQHDGGAEFVGDVAGGVQARHRLAEGVDCDQQVAGGPRGEAEEPQGGAAQEVLARAGRRQRLLRGRDGAAHVAAGLGDRGPVHRDQGRKGAHVVGPFPDGLADDLGHLDVGRGAGLLGGAEPGLGAVEVAPCELRPRNADGERSPLPGDRLR